MDQERLKEVLSDEEFVKELLDMEEPEQVQEALENKGISVTTGEILQVRDFMKKVESGEIPQEKVEAMANGELSEEELEEVAGGFLPLAIAGVVIGVIFVGTLTASCIDVATRNRW